MKKPLIGVLLLNMGGPDSLDDVGPFLYNLFSDRDIIKLGPALLQKPLARLIAGRRAPLSRKMYRKIGGRSPLKAITQRQAEALATALAADGTFHVSIAMRYWQPSAAKALTELVDLGAEAIVALPLYPHYSRATTGSSLKDLRQAQEKIAPRIPLLEIPSWPDHPLYIEALAAMIEQGLQHFAGEPSQIVYSAHSLPVSLIDAGDPYVDELNRTINALERRTRLTGRLSYQSRSGPVNWLSPSTTEMIKTIGEEGYRNILMVPISFVSDHLETLYEIGLLFREQAATLGIRLRPTKSLNTSPRFIDCLTSLVRSRLSAGFTPR
ncbi:MAG: ferrochelatase [Desulfopila sp.]